ncbi:hypothetical protein [Brevibacterium litoralis]|uniref:hypothetical protein n=1 Tax=Brevibacterium litoralis TaxID=3138935 RepID=UPI0032EEEC59
MPQSKHIGEDSKTLLLRSAIALGLEDEASGRLSEATICNLAFWDGKSVIQPCAQVLPGVTMSILVRRFRLSGIPRQTCDVRLDELGDCGDELGKTGRPESLRSAGDAALRPRAVQCRVGHQ